MSSCPKCEPDNPAARYADTCLRHRVEENLPAHYIDCDRFQTYNYGTRSGTCDCTATADFEALLASSVCTPADPAQSPENAEPGQFRLDGRPRATARAEHPGVVLSLPHTDVGALRYATDRYLTWQDNLRAIALGLEALRKVDRYGITRRGEQYAGFKAIGSGIAMPGAAAAVQMTVEEAAAVVVELSDMPYDAGLPERVITQKDSRDFCYRRAAKSHHPDAGGDRATWDRLEQAKHVLDVHGAGR